MACDRYTILIMVITITARRLPNANTTTALADRRIWRFHIKYVLMKKSVVSIKTSNAVTTCHRNAYLYESAFC
jgi:hypothetical protein